MVKNKIKIRFRIRPLTVLMLALLLISCLCYTAAMWYRETYGTVFSVNSSHHQALDQLGSGLKPVLWSESGIIEAVEHESFPLISTQFHPERMTVEKARPDTVDGKAIFDRFIAMCTKD